MPRHLSVRLFLVLGCLLGFSDVVAAQEVGRVEQVESNTQPYYFFLRPGEATTQLYVWGNVRAPGLYGWIRCCRSRGAPSSHPFRLPEAKR